MKKLFASTLLVLAPALALASAPAKVPAGKSVAQQTKAKSVPVAKSKGKAHPKAVTAKLDSNQRTPRTKAAIGAAALGGAALGTVALAHSATPAAIASPETLSIAQQVHTGTIACELGASVRVTPDPQAPGHFHVDGKGFKYHMAPVATSTGTVRLEDQKAGAVWLQIANKSMLMDQKRGQRLADECMSPEQVVVAEAIKKNPPPSVLDAQPVNR